MNNIPYRQQTKSFMYLSVGTRPLADIFLTHLKNNRDKQLSKFAKRILRLKKNYPKQ